MELIQADVDAPLRETAGKNRHPRIDSFNRRTGVVLGSPYCAAGAWCAIDDACKALGLKNPVKPTASSQAFRRETFVPLKYLRPATELAKKGYGVVFQNPLDKERGHYATVSEDQKASPYFKTVEYNTDAVTGDRDGDGAYAMVRTNHSRTKENSGKILVCFVDVPQWIVDYNLE